MVNLTRQVSRRLHAKNSASEKAVELALNRNVHRPSVFYQISNVADKNDTVNVPRTSRLRFVHHKRKYKRIRYLFQILEKFPIVLYKKVFKNFEP